MDRIGLYLNGMSGKRLFALDDAILKNLEDVKSFGVAQQNNVNSVPDILIQIARDDDDSGAQWTGLRRFSLNDMFKANFDPRETRYMPNAPTMLSEAALKDFLNALLPDESRPERTVLVLGGHADGAGVVLDDFPVLKQLYSSSVVLTSVIQDYVGDVTPHWLSSQEFVAAIGLITERYVGKRLGVIAFDACENASLELATEMAPYAHYLVASETGSPSDGWGYADWPSTVLGEAVNAKEAAAGLVASYATRISSQNSQQRASLTGLKLDAINDLCEALFGLSNLVLVDDNKLRQLMDVRSSFSPLIEREFFRVDIKSFFETLGDEPGVDADIQIAAKKIVSAVDDMVESRFWSTKNAGVSGVSIVFPFLRLEFLSNWKDVYMDRQYFPQFKAKTRWHEVLVAIYAKSRES